MNEWKNENARILSAFENRLRAGYRGISLCSIFAKVYDLVFINKFYDHYV